LWVSNDDGILIFSQDLIERWLYNVDSILPPDSSKPFDQVLWWNEDEECILVLGEYIGQGRYLRYGGAGEYLMGQISHFLLGDLRDNPGTGLQSDGNSIMTQGETELSDFTSPPSRDVTIDEAAEAMNEHDAAVAVVTSSGVPIRAPRYGLGDMRQVIVRRGSYWWACWFAGEAIVSIAIFAAFTVAFNTPTIGFGCRAFSYTVQWALSTVSWLIIGFTAQPKEWQRCVSLVFNTLSACFFILLMVFQVRLSIFSWRNVLTLSDHRCLQQLLLPVVVVWQQTLLRLR
jgi:hypothetical protein